MASFGQNPYGAPNPLTPNMVPPVVKSTIQTGETAATNWYLQNSGTAYDQQDKTANRAVQVSTTLAIATLAVSAAGPEAAPLVIALDMASNIAGLVGYGMELHDALKSHNKKMETEAIIGIVASGIGLGAYSGIMLKGIEHSTELFSKLATREMPIVTKEFEQASRLQEMYTKFAAKANMKAAKTEMMAFDKVDTKYVGRAMTEEEIASKAKWKSLEERYTAKSREYSDKAWKLRSENKKLISAKKEAIQAIKTRIDTIGTRAEKVANFMTKKRAIVPFIENIHARLENLSAHHKKIL